MTARSKRKKKYRDLEHLDKFKKIIIAVVVIIFLVLGIYRDEFKDEKYGNVEDVKYSFHFPDIGQGDCTVITSDNSCVVVDTGSENEDYLCAEYANSVADKVDCLILTHPHEDHIGGALELIEVLDVSCILIPDIDATTERYNVYLDSIRKKNIKIEIAKAGSIYTFGDIRLEILGPIREDESNLNNSSIVVKAVTEDVSVLITGDIESKAEKLLVEKYSDAALKADILKVPHHGSETSSTEEFLDAVSPTYAVIGCGLYNTFGHPADQTLERLRERKIEFYVTFKDSHIVFVSDGKNIAKAQ